MKSKETFIRKYGVDHPMKLDKFKYKGQYKSYTTKVKNGVIIPNDKLTEWELYRRKVRKLTERNRETLLNNWNGFDYYENNYIKDNFIYDHTDPRYPTLDHKISIMYGFKNNISAEIISYF